MSDRSPASHLPEHIRERVRIPADQTPPDDGEFVLYWMRTAVRGHENPALDCALLMAERLEVPCFVYHGVSERHPYASDRIHQFILEGARDVREQLSTRNIGYACHVERPGHRGDVLRKLAGRAALVVTEDMPVEPLLSWTETLEDDSEPPTWSVDTDCIVPMRLVGQSYSRAYKFRNATEDLRAERIGRQWTEQADPERAHIPGKLPFEPVDLANIDLAELIAECRIDHAIGPVPETPGGSAHGYSRWEHFRDEHLDHYDKRRNNPTANGVSRLSPYLHFGQVSPFRIAREANDGGGSGADKFIDELVTWRELSHTFCFYNRDRDLESVDILPDWAQETLAEHEEDPRPAQYDWETLSRGQTDDDFWNLLQRSLLAHGELHNNVRMTWGKALLNWAPDAQTALDFAFDLNHRYALDGRDPNSYQGILWCFGHFDRPFEPEKPIMGRVRPRDTGWHAGRVDTDKFSSMIFASPVDPTPRVAVIGAGLSGLFCARTLSDHNLRAVVFDKGRGPGGRMSTRRVKTLDDGTTFDHGAQYFTARDERFRRYVDAWRTAGLVRCWRPRVGVYDGDTLSAKESDTQRFVGTPGMNEICRHLAEDIDVEYQTRVGEIAREGDAWLLETDDGRELGHFDRVIVTAPPTQTFELLERVNPSFLEHLRRVDMQPCWALMAAFSNGLDSQFDGAFVNEGPLIWIARNAAKPGRETDHDTWVMHADHEWTREHLEEDADAVAAELLDAFFDVLGIEPSETAWHHAHRWRYAKAKAALKEGALYDTELGIGACGDWSAGNRVEGAFLAGMSAAGRILGSLDPGNPQAQLELLS